MRDILLSKRFRLISSLTAAVLMVPFIMLTCGLGGANAVAAGVAFGLIYAAALLIPVLSRSESRASDFIFTLLAVSALIYIRVMLLYYRSGDYNSFLVNWVEEMRGMSLTEAMRANIGDYNMPYMYVLFIISRIPCSDLILIKAFSCLFDVLLAGVAMLIVRHLTASETKGRIAYIAMLALPTAALNGAMWGQCDSVYAFFCVAAFYLLLKKRGSLAVLSVAVAFSFKLQTVFIFPALVLCLLCGRLKPRALLWFPVGVAAMSLPALLCGRGLADTFMIYIRQTQSYPSLDMNCPTVFRLVYNVEFDSFNMIGIMLGGLAAVTVLYVGWRLRDRLDGSRLLALFCLSAVALVYFLPRMHERYYFLADVFSLMLVLVNRKYWYAPTVIILSSFTAYAYYLFGGVTLIDYVWLSLTLLAVISRLTFDIIRDGTRAASSPLEADCREAER